MSGRALSADGLRTVYPAGTVAHNPITGEYVLVLEHTAERSVGEMVAVPGGAVAGPHHHPEQSERFEVIEGVMGYKRGDQEGTLTAGESMTVQPGVVHDWWNAGEDNLRARITVSPPGKFAAMIGAVWGLAALGRSDAKGMPRIVDAALLAEAFGDEIVFERPPQPIQRLLVALVAPIARRRGRSVTSDEVLTAAIVGPERWPAADRDGNGG